MTFIQKLVMNFLPKSWSQAIRHESENWVLRCPNCDFERSVWELGGVRYKAASVGKRLMARCPNCSQVSMMPLVYNEKPKYGGYK